MKIAELILIGAVAFSICGCGGKKTEYIKLTETETAQKTEITETKIRETATCSFEDFVNLQFSFSSGAGGWETTLNIRDDGSFSGKYFDGELGLTGEDYPEGTIYQCNFSGQFTEPVMVNDYTYSMHILELNYEREVGEEEIKNGLRYCYSDASGLEGADLILVYLPGAPLAELPEEFRSWIGYYDLAAAADTELPFYALNNESQQYGFSSCNMIDDLKASVASVEDMAANIEKSLEKDALSQAELNEKTLELYELWDSALNKTWDVLKKTQETEKMRRLTIEEREWIGLKEKTAKEAGAEFAGGSMQSMIVNQKSAEMTRERVYELLELLGPELQ